jgi:hypothetical protein
MDELIEKNDYLGHTYALTGVGGGEAKISPK